MHFSKAATSLLAIVALVVPTSLALQKEYPEKKKKAPAPQPKNLRRAQKPNNNTMPMDLVLNLPAIDGTAPSIQEFVLAVIDAGMDQNQIMGVLHSKGYDKEKLELIFQGHNEENDVLVQAFQKTPAANALNSTRNLVWGEARIEGIAKKGFAPGELEARLKVFEDEARARFPYDAHRHLQSASCAGILSLSTNLGSQVSAAYEAFTSSFNAQGYASLIDDASSVGQERMIAKSILSLPLSQLMSCVAKSIDSTISIEYSFDATFLFFNADFGINIIFGEEGQFAVSRTTGYGFDLGLLGVGIATGVSVSNRQIHGGFDTIGSSFKDPDVCFSIGYTPFIVGGAITFSITPSAVGTGSENDVVSKISNMIAGTKQIQDGDLLNGLLGLFGGSCADVSGW